MASTRKGSVRDILPTLAVVPSTILVLWVMGRVATALFGTSQLGGGPAEAATMAALGNLDYAALAITLAFFVFSIILAYKIPAHPAALPISLVFLAIVVFAGSLISNIFVAIAAELGVLGMFSLSDLLIVHFPKVLGALGLVIIFVQYSSGGPQAAERRAL